MYIMASPTGTIYIGVTNNLLKRTWQHKMNLSDGFTKKYNCSKLIYYEEYNDINEAIRREKQLKNWSRYKKEKLIKIQNPGWLDLIKEPNLER
ncbi:GIY-YIG nuclease family protein [Patescibacteria group bacterium]|nr:GIY-YIG nuclease family protein [Patescibacteria group bacterium]MBU1896098.1 GIY-YIG nuclease family protein [Patescibacteria group bacterium]